MREDCSQSLFLFVPQEISEPSRLVRVESRHSPAIKIVACKTRSSLQQHFSWSNVDHFLMLTGCYLIRCLLYTSQSMTRFLDLEKSREISSTRNPFLFLGPFSKFKICRSTRYRRYKSRSRLEQRDNKDHDLVSKKERLLFIFFRSIYIVFFHLHMAYM